MLRIARLKIRAGFQLEDDLMRTLFVAGGVFAAGIVSAAAADFPVKAAPMAPLARPIYDWTGFYLGLNAGGAWAHNCLDMNGALLFGFSPPIPEGCNNGTG